ncbi:transaldolase [Candidatus Haliotispira prima]|uniref:Transaldolase n=1 Tax=Candidatus Haliotispira prima TaxID=3034016 RepID=A0ABY8MIT2_9SPIO|nr:transaldolase [Candidatus Haliotispira prima]
MSRLDSLKKNTIVVADSGDINSIKEFQPQDCTTNPSLIFKAASMPRYSELFDSAIRWGKKQNAGGETLNDLICRRLGVVFGSELLKIVPGYVSTEVDASLSFDRDASIDTARQIISWYEELGYTRDRILIKMASTWAGIQAAAVLEKEGIRCNLTLLFSFAQAIACAEAGVTLISPFVGRIMDWHKKAEGRDFASQEDPGVLSVQRIYRYYNTYGYKTIVMGASFRNVGQIEELCGCDRLTISPALLADLKAADGELPIKLSPGQKSDDAKVHLEEKDFLWLHNEDPMATEKLAEGIRLFNQDLLKLKKMIDEKL